MYVSSAASPHETGTPAGINEIAEGLMLLRASTLKIIRLQLAIERHDRQVALEAMDNLVALDRRLQDFLEGAPGTRDQLMFRRELDSDRAALDHEKLTLGAEVLRRPMITIEQSDPVEAAENDSCRSPGVQVERLGRRRWWLAAVAILILGSAGAYVVSVPDAFASIEQAAGAMR